MTDTADEPIRIGLTLKMHDPDEVVLTSAAYGLKPTIVIEVQVDEDDDEDAVELHVDAYGIGVEKSDVLGIADVLELLVDAIREQTEHAYTVATVER